jgi:pimeloyl-ACP methyl ester carboxylesterase
MAQPASSADSAVFYNPQGAAQPEMPRRGAIGWLFGWPWIDPAASFVLRRWYFRLSRLWAAAGVAGGSPDRFFEAVPLDPLRSPRYGVAELLARFEQSRINAGAIDAAWHRAFFEGSGVGGGEPSEGECLALEMERMDTAHRHNLMRFQFRRFLRLDTPRVRFDIPSPAEVEAVYGGALADPCALFTAPDPMPEVSVSRSIPTPHGRDFWISFASPSERLGDRVYARVYEPAGVKNPPTLIFGHGICIEFDHWRRLIDEVGTLRARGIRVIRPEAPWHGRRSPAGYYGGERGLSTFPMGNLDLFTGAVREWAVLADWARRTSSGPLAFGGSSLGALTAQLAGERSRDWPEAARPQALLLITHCSQLFDTVAEGELMRIWGGYDLLEGKGWRSKTLDAYLSLLSPGPLPPVAPERIVTVLGRRDRITPFAGGLKQIEQWRIPDENRFIWDRGHFSIPATMMRNGAPVERFCEIVKNI